MNWNEKNDDEFMFLVYSYHGFAGFQLHNNHTYELNDVI